MDVLRVTRASVSDPRSGRPSIPGGEPQEYIDVTIELANDSEERPCYVLTQFRGADYEAAGRTLSLDLGRPKAPLGGEEEIEVISYHVAQPTRLEIAPNGTASIVVGMPRKLRLPSVSQENPSDLVGLGGRSVSIGDVDRVSLSILHSYTPYHHPPTREFEFLQGWGEVLNLELATDQISG